VPKSLPVSCPHVRFSRCHMVLPLIAEEARDVDERGIFRKAPVSTDKIIRNVDKRMITALPRMNGFKGAYWLLDRRRDTFISCAGQR